MNDRSEGPGFASGGAGVGGGPGSGPGPEGEGPVGEPPPFGQRLFDRPFVLLGLGIFVMFAFFTVWGLFEILSLTPAPLP